MASDQQPPRLREQGMAALARQREVKKDRFAGLRKGFAVAAGMGGVVLRAGIETGKRIAVKVAIVGSVGGVVVGGASGVNYLLRAMDDGIPRDVKEKAWSDAEKEWMDGLFANRNRNDVEGRGRAVLNAFFEESDRGTIVSDDHSFDDEASYYQGDVFELFVTTGAYAGTRVTVDPMKGPKGSITIKRDVYVEKYPVYGWTYKRFKPLPEDRRINVTFDLAKDAAEIDIHPDIPGRFDKTYKITTNKGDTRELLGLKGSPSDLVFDATINGKSSRYAVNLKNGSFMLVSPCFGNAACRIAQDSATSEKAGTPRVSGKIPTIYELTRKAGNDMKGPS